MIIDKYLGSKGRQRDCTQTYGGMGDRTDEADSVDLSWRSELLRKCGANLT